MSILVRFHPKNLTAEQYDQVVRQEKNTEPFPPDGQGVPRLLSELTETFESVKSGTPRNSSRRTAKS